MAEHEIRITMKNGYGCVVFETAEEAWKAFAKVAEELKGESEFISVDGGRMLFKKEEFVFMDIWEVPVPLGLTCNGGSLDEYLDWEEAGEDE